MKLNIGFWMAIAGICCCCRTNSPEQASLSDAKIARIMADINIADAATNGLNGYLKDSLMDVYFKQVFEMHGTTKEVYEQDLRIVAKDLIRMEAIVKQADILLTDGGKGPSN